MNPTVGAKAVLCATEEQRRTILQPTAVLVPEVHEIL
jgi:hypothetical protein